jgi:hypothetical protein
MIETMMTRTRTMSGTEAKEAMINGSPVVYCSGLVGAIEYERINAIIYRQKDGRISVSLELLDQNLHSVTIAPMEEVELLVLQVKTQ